jgi:hypothetical protein
MPRVGFEPSIPVFQRAKTVNASDRAAAVIGLKTSLMFLEILHVCVRIKRDMKGTLLQLKCSGNYHKLFKFVCIQL